MFLKGISFYCQKVWHLQILFEVTKGYTYTLAKIFFKEFFCFRT